VPQRISLFIQPLLQILDSGDSLLCIDDHFHEQEGETGSIELSITASIKIPVVDRLSIQRHS